MFVLYLHSLRTRKSLVQMWANFTYSPIAQTLSNQGLNLQRNCLLKRKIMNKKWKILMNINSFFSFFKLGHDTKPYSVLGCLIQVPCVQINKILSSLPIQVCRRGMYCTTSKSLWLVLCIPLPSNHSALNLMSCLFVIR